MGFRDTLRQIWTGDQEALYRASLGDPLQVIPSGSRAVDLPVDVAAGFGVTVSDDRVTRRQAMSVPAVKRGRSIIAGTIGTLAFVPTRAGQDGSVERVTSGSAATLLARLDPMATPQFTKTWTVDDMLFYGIGWWFVTERDASTNYPTAVRRISPERVRITLGTIYVDNHPLSAAEVANLIRFDAPDEGLLCAARALRTCLDLEDAVRRNAKGQPPQDYLRPAEGAAELTPTQVDELLDNWEDARRRRSTAWLNRAVEHGVVGFDPQKGQLAEARQYQAAEVARLMNMDPGRLGAPSGSSKTYSTQEGERRDLVDVTLRPYLSAFQERLSMPDVTPHGTSVLVDTLPFLRGTTADAINAGALAVSSGLLSEQEVRVDLLGRPAVPELGTLRAPAAAPQLPAGGGS